MIGRILALLFFPVAFVACDPGGPADHTRSLDELVGGDALRLGSDSVPLFTDVIAVLSLDESREGRFVVVDLGHPFLHYFDGEGRHLSSRSREGRGPGELEGPWRAALFPTDSLAVIDASGLRFLGIDGSEGSREAPPSNSAALLEACGTLTAVVLAGAAEGGRDFTLRRKTGPERWDFVGDFRPMRSPLVPVGRHFQALPVRGGVAIADPFDRRLEILDCDGEARRSGPDLPVPEEWRLPPAVTGAERLAATWLVFTWMSSVASRFDGTRFTVWNPDTDSTFSILVPDHEVHLRPGGAGADTFIVLSDLIPSIYALDKEDLADFLGVGPE